MKKNPSLQSQAKALFFGNLVATLFQFLIPSILVRFISQEDFGIYRQFQLLAVTFLGLLGMGYQSSLFYFFPISKEMGRNRIIQQTMILLGINVFVFLLILLFFGDKMLVALNFSEFLEMKSYIFFYISFMLLSSVVLSIFTLEKKTLHNKVYPSLEKITSFIFFIVVIFIVPGYLGPIIALLLFSLSRLLFFLWYSRDYLLPILKIDTTLVKRQLIYSLPFGLALILNQISVKFDKFFINQYITVEEFAVYSMAFLGIPVLKQFFQSIHNVVVPEISKLITEGNMPQATLLWQKTVDKTSSVTIPLVFLFFILADELITVLYTENYIEAANYYRVFLFIFLISMFSHELILRGSNKTRFILYSNIVGAVVTIGLGFLIIPKFGLYGAVYTALAGSITPMIISLLVEKKLMKLSLTNWINWKRLFYNFGICTIIAFPLYSFKDNISNIFIRGILVGLIYGLLVVYLQLRFDLFLFKDQFLKIKKAIVK